MDTALTRRFWWLAPAVGWVATAHSLEGDTSTNFTMAGDYQVMVTTNSGAVLEQCGPRVAAARILPNPCSGSATLCLGPGLAGPVSVRVCDAAGRVVLSQAARGGAPMRLDLRGNRAGLYFCTATIGNRVVTEPLAILR